MKRSLDSKKGNSRIVGRRVMFMANGVQEVWGTVELGYLHKENRGDTLPVHMLIIKAEDSGELYHLKPRYIRSIDPIEKVKKSWFCNLLSRKDLEDEQGDLLPESQDKPF